MAGYLRLDTSEYDAQLAVLRRPWAPIVRAINRSMGSAQTTAVRAITADLGLKRAAVVPHVKLRKATPAVLSATLYASAKRVPLVQFHATGPEPSRGKGQGVSARIGGKRTRYQGAFIATMPSGHRGVYRRQVGQARLPIRELRGPSIWRSFQTAQPQAAARANEQLATNLAHEIAFALSRGR